MKGDDMQSDIKRLQKLLTRLDVRKRNWNPYLRETTGRGKSQVSKWLNESATIPQYVFTILEDKIQLQAVSLAKKM